MEEIFQERTFPEENPILNKRREMPTERKPGTLGITRTRQSGSDKLTGFRTRSGSFIGVSTYRAAYIMLYEILSSDRDIICFAHVCI